MNDSPDIAERLAEARERALHHTEQSLEHMARYGIRPEGQVGLFLPPEARQSEIHRMPYEHAARQVVVYETEMGEFSALCPFSGLPDFGTLRIEYVPGSWLLELKSLKYYLISWRNIGAAQEDITALMYEDLHRWLGDPERLVVTTVYNVRGGINTTCTVDSREQGNEEPKSGRAEEGKRA
ncbi:MAG: preQ(1) synthase [Rhodothermales bacterium]